MFKNFCLAFLSLYALLCLILFIGQRRLIFPAWKGLPSDSDLVAKKLRYWQKADSKYRGFISEEPDEPVKGTIIVFHGNGDRADNQHPYPIALTKKGYRLLLAEYPGYGGRDGKPSESALVKDARSIITDIHQEFGEPIYLWGSSIGSGVVASTVADPKLPVAGVVLFTPWDSLGNVVQYKYPLVPARWLLLDKFLNIQNLNSFGGKVAILVAKQDRVVPTKFGLNLYEAIANPKKLWTFENSGHSNWPNSPDESWWQEVVEFMEE